MNLLFYPLIIYYNQYLLQLIKNMEKSTNMNFKEPQNFSKL